MIKFLSLDILIVSQNPIKEKVARKASNIGEVWNQYVVMVTKLLSSYHGANKYHDDRNKP